MFTSVGQGIRVLLVAVLVLASACGSATVGGVGMPPASAKWLGPPVLTPDGGEVRFAIYYGPWSCNSRQMASCQSQCRREGRVALGCIWLADIKGDWVGRWMWLPAEAGTRYPLTHCCCDYPAVDPESGRQLWSNARDAFRRSWADEFGQWPTTAGRNWPGHHIHDLAHGGHPTSPRNLLPVPPEVHSVFNGAYPQCYTRGSRWSVVGPDLPYSD
ncbi:hypothetical protein WA016_07607 [Myxococcus stipitatus]